MDDLLKRIQARFVGVELYFDDLERARAFYTDTLGLKIAEEDPQRYCKFEGGSGFSFCSKGHNRSLLCLFHLAN